MKVWSFFLVVLLAVGQATAHAQPLKFDAILESNKDAPPDEVYLSLKGVPVSCIQGAAAPSLCPVERGTGRNSYTYEGILDLSPTTAWETVYVLGARWGGSRQKIFLRASRSSPPSFKIWLLNRGYSADKYTLTKLPRGGDLPELLERYFVARDVYNGIANPSHSVRIEALAVWNEAALDLAREFPFIAQDPDVKKLVSLAAERQKVDPEYRAAVVKVVSGSYFPDANKRHLELAWRDAGLIAKFSEGKDVAKAQALNRYLFEEYKALSPRDRQIFVLDKGMNENTFKNNEAYFRTLQGQGPEI